MENPPTPNEPLSTKIKNVGAISKDNNSDNVSTPETGSPLIQVKRLSPSKRAGIKDTKSNDSSQIDKAQSSKSSLLQESNADSAVKNECKKKKFLKKSKSVHNEKSTSNNNNPTIKRNSDDKTSSQSLVKDIEKFESYNRIKVNYFTKNSSGKQNDIPCIATEDAIPDHVPLEYLLAKAACASSEVNDEVKNDELQQTNTKLIDESSVGENNERTKKNKSKHAKLSSNVDTMPNVKDKKSKDKKKKPKEEKCEKTRKKVKDDLKPLGSNSTELMQNSSLNNPSETTPAKELILPKFDPADPLSELRAKALLIPTKPTTNSESNSENLPRGTFQEVCLLKFNRRYDEPESLDDTGNNANAMFIDDNEKDEINAQPSPQLTENIKKIPEKKTKEKHKNEYSTNLNKDVNLFHKKTPQFQIISHTIIDDNTTQLNSPDLSSPINVTQSNVAKSSVSKKNVKRNILTSTETTENKHCDNLKANVKNYTKKNSSSSEPNTKRHLLASNTHKEVAYEPSLVGLESKKKEEFEGVSKLGSSSLSVNQYPRMLATTDLLKSAMEKIKVKVDDSKSSSDLLMPNLNIMRRPTVQEKPVSVPEVVKPNPTSKQEQRRKKKIIMVENPDENCFFAPSKPKKSRKPSAVNETIISKLKVPVGENAKEMVPDIPRISFALNTRSNLATERRTAGDKGSARKSKNAMDIENINNLFTKIKSLNIFETNAHRSFIENKIRTPIIPCSDKYLNKIYFHLPNMPLPYEPRVKEKLVTTPSLTYAKTLDDILNNPKQQMLLFSLPQDINIKEEKPVVDETIVYLNGEKEEEERLRAAKDITMPTEPIKQKEGIKNIFRDMPEGQIGRLIRYKSGKIKMVMANLEFDLQMDYVKNPSLIDIVSIHPNYEGKESKIINLGSPGAVLMAGTNWCHVLEQARLELAETAKNSKASENKTELN